MDSISMRRILAAMGHDAGMMEHDGDMVANDADAAMDGGGGFCSSMHSGGMVMYMDGFRFGLKGGQPCLNLYFPGWTLDTRGKFVAAMIGVIVLSIFVEGISKLRFLVQRQLLRRNHNSHELMLKYRQSLITILHGLQAFVGYILMLATMTFSGELLLCVVFGLGAGYYLFYEDTDRHVTTNPCCSFIQGEADDRELNLKMTAPKRTGTPTVSDGEEEPSQEFGERTAIDAAVQARSEPEVSV